MEIRDPIHGIIEYNKAEQKIIDSRPFQRLRRIKQLALASYLYPGANHTRFEHSLGVMHVASSMYDRLMKNAEKRKLEVDTSKYSREAVRYAGLLHDIGHGPFSHVSEYILAEINKDNPKNVGGEKIEEFHEFITVRIIENFIDGISCDLKETIVEIIKKPRLQNAFAEIISGPLDADKFDYLLRDSYYAGVKYGIFDLDRILNIIEIIQQGKSISSLGIREEGVYNIEQFILSKYFIDNQVYRHINRNITDQMIVRCVEFAYEEKIEEVIKLYEFRDEPEYYEDYINYYDDKLLQLISDKSDGKARKIAERILNRKLLKYSLPMKIEDIKDAILRRKTEAILNNSNKRKIIEKEVAQLLDFEYNDLIILNVDPKNPLLKLYPSSKDQEESIMSIDKQGYSKNFSEESQLSQNVPTLKNFGKIFIFAPFEESGQTLEWNKLMKIFENNS